jgi:hypothetical protein
LGYLFDVRKFVKYTLKVAICKQTQKQKQTNMLQTLQNNFGNFLSKTLIMTSIVLLATSGTTTFAAGRRNRSKGTIAPTPIVANSISAYYFDNGSENAQFQLNTELQSSAAAIGKLNTLRPEIFNIDKNGILTQLYF